MTQHQTAQQLESDLSTKGAELLWFSAQWCGPCKYFKPVMASFIDANKDKVSVRPIDVDDSANIALKFNVRAVPSLVIAVDGKEVERTSGFKNERELSRWFDEHKHLFSIN